MKKVSVFTVLTCFLAGTANFSCYAGTGFSKMLGIDSDASNEADASKAVVSAPPKTAVKQNSTASTRASSQQVGQNSGQGGVPSSHPKPMPSSDLAQADFYPASLPPKFEEGDVLSAEQVAALLQQEGEMPGVTFSVRKPPSVLSISAPRERQGQSSSGTSQPTLIGDDKAVPPALHSSSSGIPSILPALQELPHGGSKPVVSVPSSSSNHGETYEVGGGVLTLPVTMKLFPKLDAPGQVALVPKVCALSFYNYLSELDSSESKIRGKMFLLTASNKDEIFGLIKTYLDRHGKRNGQIFAAQKIFEGLKRAIETPNERKITFRVAPVEGKPEVYFCLEVEGGVIIFGKIPGQEL